MAVLLALLSAGAYGVSDFLGGIFARRASGWTVAVVGQTSSAICMSLVAVSAGGHPYGFDLGWGGLAGASSGVGAAFLYRGLASGRMSVVAPLSAVGASIVPVVVGLATGDRPRLTAWIGIVLAVPAILLITRVPSTAAAVTVTSHRASVIDGLLAGAGFGLLFALLGQVSDGAGLYPLAVGQAASVLAVVALATALRVDWVPRTRAPWRALMMGPLGATATGAFLLSTHHGLLAIVAVIASLYPATTVLLAGLVLRERIHLAQAVGLALATICVVCVATG